MGLPSTVSRGQYLLHPKQLQLREVEIGKLGPEEVEIAPRSTTICGSDLHYYAHGRNGSITVKEPLCLGHESAGDVVAVGTAVNGLRPGDRVAVECGVPCSECELCVEGRYNLCPKLRFRSSGSAFPHFQGTLQERIIHPAKWVHRLPDCLTFDDGALLEPLSVACHAVRRAGVTPASTCLVFGAGAVGLLCAAVARSKGCARIVMCDIDKRRVNFALQKASPRWGVPSCVQSSIYATKSGGRVMLVGMGTPNHTLPLSEAGAREVDLMSTWRYANCYEEAIDLMTKVAEGSVKPDIREIITHHHKGLENVQDAFGLAGSSQDSDGNLVIKVVIDT
ncbi:Alcohol dehydrogenase GroES-like domain-containing protein [Cladophialophora immunda]|nr:Alcohol dehydrogenase GroES-like domain-containing protein [Cladophialophora immunda]